METIHFASRNHHLTLAYLPNKIGLLQAGTSASNATSVGIQTGYTTSNVAALANATTITNVAGNSTNSRANFVGQPVGQGYAVYTTGSAVTLPVTPKYISPLSTTPPL